MNNCTLIIDGNWLLMSRLGPKLPDFRKSNPTDVLEAASAGLIDFLAQSVNKIINFFEGNIDNILMVQDGGSWRKSFEKPKLYTDEYKANRQAQEDIDWSYIWSALNRFCQNFQDNNITCTQARSIEGDDWCWFWSRWCNHNDTNTIIWTSDCDLKQLVQCDPNTNRWTAWFNDRAGLVVHEHYDHTSMSDIDRFFEFEMEDPQINSLIDNVLKRGHKVTYINPDIIRMNKIVCGDAGDNIKSIIRVKKGTKNLRVSSKEWEGIRETLNINKLQDFLNNTDNIINEAKQLKRFKDCDDSVEDIKDMFKYNCHMVILDKEYIPKEQRNIMRSKIDEYKVTDIEYLRNNYRVLGSQSKIDIDDLFASL